MVESRRNTKFASAAAVLHKTNLKRKSRIRFLGRPWGFSKLHCSNLYQYHIAYILYPPAFLIFYDPYNSLLCNHQHYSNVYYSTINTAQSGHTFSNKMIKDQMVLVIMMRMTVMMIITIMMVITTMMMMMMMITVMMIYI